MSEFSDRDPGRGPAIMGVGWTLTTLCLIAIGLRFYVRLKYTRCIAIDDWLMLLAGALQIVNAAFATRAYIWGLGMHDADLSFDEIVNALKWVWLGTFPGLLVTIIARVSIAILLVRIFGTKRLLKWYLIIFTTLTSIATLVLLIIIWVQVSPIQGLWNPLLPARRWDPKIELYAAYTAGSFVAFSDLTYVLFPVMIVWRLNMATRKKVGLCVLLALSLITLAFSILKTVTAESSGSESDEPQYAASLSSVWDDTEQCLVIIMGCIPTLKPLAHLEFPALRSITRSWTGLLGSSSRKTVPDSRDTDLHSTGPYLELGPADSLSRPATHQDKPIRVYAG